MSVDSHGSRKMMAVVLAALLMFSAGSETILAQKRKIPPRTRRTIVDTPVTSIVTYSPDIQRRVETFDKVWTTIHTYYFDPTFNNLDWNKVRDEFRPRAIAAKTDIELHDLLAAMIARLGRSHLLIIPPSVYEAIETAKIVAKERERKRRTLNENGSTIREGDDAEMDEPHGGYGTGIHVRRLGDKFLIARIDQGSTADRAGLRTGYAIDSINDVSLNLLLEKVRSGGPALQRFERYLPLEVVEFMLNGDKDSAVKIAYLDGSDTRREVSLIREHLKSEPVSVAPNFPETQFRFETSSLNDNVGLIRFNSFSVKAVGKFCDALREFKDK